MKTIIKYLSIILSFQIVQAKKIDIELFSDINKKIRFDIYYGENNIDAGNILKTGEIASEGSFEVSKVKVPKNVYLKVIAKVIETGEVVELPWEVEWRKI
jgi:hypothetical protein